MKINIAGQQLLLTVPFSDQDYTRETEKNLNSLYETWCKRFPDKSETELLAMIAFQYASHYDALTRTYIEADTKASKIEERLEVLAKAKL